MSANIMGIVRLISLFSGTFTDVCHYDKDQIILWRMLDSFFCFLVLSLISVNIMEIVRLILMFSGTSTDVSRYDGNYEIVFEASLAGLTIQSPQLDIQTVAAGGGSVLFFRSGLFVVGPASAGAHPGPACYRKGLVVCHNVLSTVMYSLFYSSVVISRV